MSRGPTARYLHADQVAAIIGLSVSTVYRYCREGRLPSLKVGADRSAKTPVRIPVEALKAKLVEWGDPDALAALRTFSL